MKPFEYIFKVNKNTNLIIKNGACPEATRQNMTSANLTIALESNKHFPSYLSEEARNIHILNEIYSTSAEEFYSKWHNKRYKQFFIDTARELDMDIDTLKAEYNFIGKFDGEIFINDTRIQSDKEIDDELLYLLDELGDRNDKLMLLGVYNGDEIQGITNDFNDAVRKAQQLQGDISIGVIQNGKWLNVLQATENSVATEGFAEAVLNLPEVAEQTDVKNTKYRGEGR